VASVAVLFATIVFMSGGVLGTLHHLYFVGTPTAVMALGASFSALEVVPLAYIGFEAYHTYKLGKATPWMAATAGRSCSSSRSASGTWWAPACSAS
jgi:nitric oxide reductase subunit B